MFKEHNQFPFIGDRQGKLLPSQSREPVLSTSVLINHMFICLQFVYCSEYFFIFLIVYPFSIRLIFLSKFCCWFLPKVTAHVPLVVKVSICSLFANLLWSCTQSNNNSLNLTSLSFELGLVSHEATSCPKCLLNMYTVAYAIVSIWLSTLLKCIPLSGVSRLNSTTTKVLIVLPKNGLVTIGNKNKSILRLSYFPIHKKSLLSPKTATSLLLSR